jgi:hypothetical protein
MKTKQIRIRLSPDDSDLLEELCSGHGSKQSLAGIILSAACTAIRENNNRVSLPVHFTVGLHETKSKEVKK